MKTNNVIKYWKDYADIDLRTDNVDTETHIARGGLTMGTVAAGLIGVWAIACLIGGIAGGGIGDMIKGFITAIGG